MANKRIDELTLLDKANITPASDVLAMVDVSDSNNTKKVTIESAVQSTLRDAGVANGVLYLNGSKVATSGSALTFDGANLGLGVTPSAWGSAKAIQIANSTYGASLWAQGGADEVLLGRNVYYTGISNIYKGSSYATQYAQLSNGQHAWYTAPSGTAGSTISFTQAMTLTANGNLLVGGANENTSRLVDIVASTKTQLSLTYPGVSTWGISTNSDASLSFNNGTERARIDSSGNLLVGTTTSDPIANGGTNGVAITSGGIVRIVAKTQTPFNIGTGQSNLTAFFYLTGSTSTAVGTITTNGTSTAYNTSSDYRLKDNQAPLTGSGAFIDALKPKTWNWKADGTKGVGFIAHEVQEVSPTSVVGEKDATRIEQYEVSPAVPATYDEEGNELTPAVEAVMGEREVPAYQAMEYGSAEFIANIVAELQSLRKRVAALEAK